MSLNPLANERGFTLVELLVASGVTMAVLAGAVMLTSQVQTSYSRLIEDSAAEQEGRYALDWVSKLIRSAGNNPYSIATGACPATGTPFAAIVFDPDGDTVNNDIRVQMDSNPPDGLLGGPGPFPGGCTQANEDVTVSLDAANNSITFFDNNLGGSATIRTDAVISNLLFIYRDAAHVTTTDPLNVVYVETQITVRTRTIDPSTGAPTTHVLTQEVRLRGRNY